MVGAVGSQLLHDLARAADGGCIVEVGSYRGRSAITLAKGTGEGHRLPVFAVEPHEEFVGVNGGKFGPDDRAAFYRNMLETGAYEDVRLVNLPSHIAAQGWEKPISLLFIDGDHTYEGCRRDLGAWWPHLAPNAVVAFDDVNLDGPRRVMQEAIEAGRLEHLERRGKVAAARRI
jgi:predicted O-methyltransferase YrrM